MKPCGFKKAVVSEIVHVSSGQVRVSLVLLDRLICKTKSHGRVCVIYVDDEIEPFNGDHYIEEEGFIEGQ
ncbi:MAG: hypothetical protein A2Z72_08250 [Omnitrophica bacterium RBG_13_46_9]|nr:MAG: hypothetical protein A2Z72_08250 [Omnitrophica bacterium RBG_13_46_9]